MNDTFKFDFHKFYDFYKKRSEVMNFELSVYFLTRAGFDSKELTRTYRIAPQAKGQKPLRVWLEFSKDTRNKYVYFICPNQTHPKMKYGDHFTLGLENGQVMLHRTLYQGSHCRIKEKHQEWCKFNDGMILDKNEKMFDFACMGQRNAGTTLAYKYDDDQTYLNAEGITMILKEPFIEMTAERASYDDPQIYDKGGYNAGLYTSKSYDPPTDDECNMMGGKANNKLTSKEKKQVVQSLQHIMKTRNMQELVAIVDKAQDRVELITTQSS
jgi:hypothetical protein